MCAVYVGYAMSMYANPLFSKRVISPYLTRLITRLFRAYYTLCFVIKNSRSCKRKRNAMSCMYAMRKPDFYKGKNQAFAYTQSRVLHNYITV